MRKFTLILFLSVHFSAVWAQVPAWIWAKNSGSIYYESAVDISSDKNNHMLVTGTFSSPSVTIGTTSLVNNSISNMSDFYIAKYDTAGNVIWVQSYGGMLTEDATGVTSDLAGNIYVCGNFTSDTLIIANDTLYCSDSWGDSADVFIAKFDPLGNPLWARQCTGRGHEYASSIETDQAGDVYIAGDFDSDTVNFESLSMVNAGSGNNYDGFTVKYNSAGVVVWANQLGGGAYEFTKGLTVDGSGNVVISGCSYSDSLVTSAGVQHNPGYGDIFIAEYDQNGNALTIIKAAGSQGDGLLDISSDGYGGIYAVGSYDSNPCVFGTISIPMAGFYDMYLAKYSNGATGISDQTGGHGLSVYPNPFSESITIEVDDPDGGIAQIYSDDGRLIRSESLVYGSNILFMPELNSGLYLVRFESENTISWVKVLKGVTGSGN